MELRKFTYSIDYTHILQFKDIYKKIVAPFFTFQNLEYAIDNENTIDEGIRLIFKNEGFAIILKKDATILICERLDKDIFKHSSVTDIFFTMYENLKNSGHFLKTNRHRISCIFVELDKEPNAQRMLKPHRMENPFNTSLREYSSIFEFTKDQKKYKIETGNFNSEDIQKHDMTPFKGSFNKSIITKFLNLYNL